MKIVVDDLAKQSLIDIYYYNYQYSLKNAIETKNKSDFVTPPLTTFVVSGIFKDVVFKFPPISRPLFSLTVVVLDHYPSQFLGLDYFFYIFS